MAAFKHREKFEKELRKVLLVKKAHSNILEERSKRGCDKAISYLKPKQITAMLASVNDSTRNDVLAVLPTGYGKTLLFNLIPMFCSLYLKESLGISLIVAPINALIDQHVETLGWNARKLSSGKYHLLYCTYFTCVLSINVYNNNMIKWALHSLAGLLGLCVINR